MVDAEEFPVVESDGEDSAAEPGETRNNKANARNTRMITVIRGWTA